MIMYQKYFILMRVIILSSMMIILQNKTREHKILQKYFLY
jgi:hypothetical protein